MNITTKIYFIVEGKCYILTVILDYKQTVEDIYSTSLLEVADCMIEFQEFKILAIFNNLPLVKNLELNEECFYNFYDKETMDILKEWKAEYSLIFGDIKELSKDKKAFKIFYDELENREKELRLNFNNMINKYNAKGKEFSK